MTLEQFTSQRRDELLVFFKARFGKSWRQIVVRQTDMHPRTFSRWRGVSAVSLYRQIHKLETWARSIGFRSSTDVELQAALNAHEEFKKAAKHEVETAQSKRERDSCCDDAHDWSQMAAKMDDGMRNLGRRRPDESLDRR